MISRQSRSSGRCGVMLPLAGLLCIALGSCALLHPLARHPAKGQDAMFWETADSVDATSAPKTPQPTGPNQVPTLALPVDDGEQPVRPEGRTGPLVATIDFDSATMDQEQLKAISQALWTRLDAMPELALYPRNPVRRSLIRNDLFPFTPYMAPVAPDKITSFLKADYLLTGELERMDGVFSLDVNLYSGGSKRYILKDFKLQKADMESLINSFSSLNMQICQAIKANEAELKAHGPAPNAQPPIVEPTPPAEPAKVLPAATPTPTPKPKIRKPRPAPTPSAESTSATTTTRSDEQPFAAHPKATATPRPTPAPTAKAAPAMTPRATIEPTPAPMAAPTPAMTPRPTRPAPAPAETATAATTSTAAEESPADTARAQVLYQEAMRAGAPPAERLQKLEQAAALAPGAAGIQQALALEYYNQSKHPEAITQIDKAVRVHPGNSMLLTIKGSSLFELGRFGEAAQAQEDALRLDPKNFWAAFNLALALTQQRSERAPGTWRNFLALAESNSAVPRELTDRARQYLSAVTPTPVAAAGAAH